ncbi:MAG: S9 family peptidase [candidate division Zixibacteria bacterium]
MLKKKKSRKIEAGVFTNIELLTSAKMSPDEKKIAYTIENISEDRRNYYSRIHVVDIASGKSRQYTYGEVYDRGMAWSHDGKTIAFISTRNKKTGIYLMPIEGGSERKLIERDGSFSHLNWTPDGKEIVFQFRLNDSHEIKDEKKKKEAPAYRRITRLFYRLDGAGFLPRDRYHIWKVNVDGGEMIQLTKGKYDDMGPTLSHDGKLIAFVSNRSRNPDVDVMHDDIFVLPTKGGKLRKIQTPVGPKMELSFSPDSKKLAYVGHANPDDPWGVTNFHLWTVGIGGRPRARDLIPKFDRQVKDSTIGDMGEAFMVPTPVWSPDGKRIYFASSDTGCTNVFYVPAKGGLPTRVTKKKCHIKEYSFGKNCKRFAAVYSTQKTPGELHLIPAVYNGDIKSKVLTAPSRKMMTEINMPGIKEVWFKAQDGTKLQGWMITPPRFTKNRKYPAILEIHGGPRSQYGYTFYFEMLYLASQGYVVFYTNPRGGGGRGETFAGTIVGDWGTIDYTDCMAAADYLENLPFVNSKKMGVTGGSYGGYMTNWIIGHTNRFRAAVTQRSVVNLKSFFGTSDMGYSLNREFLGLPWTTEETYKRCSPLTYAGNIKTPLLIIHSEQDLRCGIEQAEQLFVTLKMMKRTAEFIRFPEEPHGLSRHGRPDRRIARLELIRNWFDKYLK